MKRLAIIIVNWNSIDLTRDTLLSLEKAGNEFDIILVDNGSINPEGELLKSEFPNLLLIRSSENLGFTGGNNIGFTYAIEKGYPYAMMLNNDVEVEPDFIAPLIKRMDDSPQIGAIQPLIYYHHNRKLIWNAGGQYLHLIGVSETLFANKLYNDSIHAQPIDWITGCAFLVRTEILESIGALKEKFFIYHEDVDLSMRIREAGYVLWIEPQSVIYHIAGMAHKSKHKTREGFVNPKVHFLNARNRIWILKKYTQPIYWPTVFLYHFLYSILISIYFIFRGRFSKLKSWWRGIREGIIYTI